MLEVTCSLCLAQHFSELDTIFFFFPLWSISQLSVGPAACSGIHWRWCNFPFMNNIAALICRLILCCRHVCSFFLKSSLPWDLKKEKKQPEPLFIYQAYSDASGSLSALPFLAYLVCVVPFSDFFTWMFASLVFILWERRKHVRLCALASECGFNARV